MKSIVKKICVYSICTCLIFTSVFMSYDNTLTVKAIDEGKYYKTAVGIALTLAGVVETVATGGSFSAVGIAQIVTGLTMAGFDLNDALHDNGDGTYTMTPEFIQLVVNEAQKIDETGFHDFESIQNPDGTYNISGHSTQAKIDNQTANRRYSDTSDKRVYAYVITYSNGTTGGYFLEKVRSQGSTYVYFDSFSCHYEEYWDGVYKNSGSSAYVGGDPSSGFSSYGVNVPVFSTEEALKNAILTNDFSGALNYREKYFDYSNRYLPTYPGGSVRISKSVLDGFDDKLKEVNEKYNDVDDRVNALYEYIFGDNIFGDGDINYDFGFDFDDLLDFVKNPFEWGASFLQELYDFFKDITDVLFNKFPFSIPNDLYKLFTILAGSGETSSFSLQTYDTGPGQPLAISLDQYGLETYAVQDDASHGGGGHSREPGSESGSGSGSVIAPYFELPIVIERYDISENIIVDLEPFQPISTLSRFLFTIVFCVGLMRFTVKVTEILKEVFE